MIFNFEKNNNTNTSPINEGYNECIIYNIN